MHDTNAPTCFAQSLLKSRANPYGKPNMLQHVLASILTLLSILIQVTLHRGSARQAPQLVPKLGELGEGHEELPVGHAPPRSRPPGTELRKSIEDDRSSEALKAHFCSNLPLALKEPELSILSPRKKANDLT